MDSQESVIFVLEEKVIHGEVHHQSVHVPETPPQNQNPTNLQEDPDNSTIFFLETIGKLCNNKHRSLLKMHVKMLSVKKAPKVMCIISYFFKK